MLVKNSNINQQNFTSFYRIPKTAINNDCLEGTVSLYQILTNRSALSYEGINPINKNISDYLKNFAKKYGGDLTWLKLNAENFGIKLPKELNTDVYTIVTGNNDTAEISKYVLKRTIINKFKRLYDILTFNFDSKSPQHIGILKYLLKYCDAENVAFEKFMAAKKVNEYSNFNDMFIAIMNEK